MNLNYHSLPRKPASAGTDCRTTLTVENLFVRLKGRTVLRGIDWRIGAGEQWAIIGPNGSGKTTLVKAIAGLIPKAKGRIVLHSADGEDRFWANRRTGVGFVSAELHRKLFEKEAFAEEVRHFTGDAGKALTASDFILNLRENGQTPSPAQVEVLEEFSADAGMTELLHKNVGALTTGEISKVLILKALINRPQLLVLDEPFNGLDREAKRAIGDVIGQLTRSGLQVVLITHRIEEILSEISHVLMMTEEGIQKQGPRAEVLQSFPARIHFRASRDPGKGAKESVNAAAGEKPSPMFSSKKAGPWAHGEKLVEMIDVTVRYGSSTVFEGLNWSVRSGENWLVTGQDGAGKSSLLKLITGDNPQAYANEIFLFGRKKGTGESVWEIKQNIGWISSELQSKYPMRIRGVEVVYSGFFDTLGLYRSATADQRRHAKRLIEALGIAELGKKKYGDLSHGQKKMLLIARAIVKGPRLLLLDEPCDGLDFSNRRKVLDIIEHIGSCTPTSVVYATADDTDAISCMARRLHLGRRTASVPAVFHQSPPCCMGKS